MRETMTAFRGPREAHLPGAVRNACAQGRVVSDCVWIDSSGSQRPRWETATRPQTDILGFPGGDDHLGAILDRRLFGRYDLVVHREFRERIPRAPPDPREGAVVELDGNR